MSDNKQDNKTQSTTEVIRQDSWVGAKSIVKSTQSSSPQPKDSEKKD